MNNQDYQYNFTAKASVDKVQQAISQVHAWWAKNFKGKAEKLNDIFMVTFGATFVTFKVVALIPHKKIIWLVTDCNLPWINNKQEWANTQVIWELDSTGDTTTIHFTHLGLIPGIECYDTCSKGWRGHLTNSLPKLISEGKGLPE